jgi:hypothetical protein
MTTALHLHPDQATELVKCAEEEMKKQKMESLDESPARTYEDDSSSAALRPRPPEGQARARRVSVQNSSLLSTIFSRPTAPK